MNAGPTKLLVGSPFHPTRSKEAQKYNNWAGPPNE
jgi:hypothetical protein